MPFCTTCGANVNGAFCQQCGTPVSAAGTSPPPYGAPPPAIGGTPAARKTNPLIWVLLIIFGLLFLGFVGVVGVGFFVAHKVKEAGIDPDMWRRNPGLAVGKIIAATNPNVEVVRSDEGAGTVTIRDKRTGKETTMTFDQARNGKFSITADDGHGGAATMQIGGAANNNLPSWVPKYPGSDSTSTFAMKGSGGNGGDGGSFTFTTPDSGEKVLQFYRDKTQGLGLKTTMNMTTGDSGMVVATEEGDRRSLTVIVSGHSPATTVSVTYGSKS